MIKTMTAVSLTSETDPEAFWRYHIGEHASEAKEIGDPQKYSISRVVEVLEGDPMFFDMVEFWWKDRESLARRDGGSSARLPMADFRNHGGINNYRCVVLERRIPVEGEGNPAPLASGTFKLMTSYRLPRGTDGDAFWEFHVGAQAARIAALGGGSLIRFSINRLTEILVGNATFFAIEELWFKNRSAALEYRRRSRIELNGESVERAFRSRGPIVEYTVGMEEAEVPISGKPWF